MARKSNSVPRRRRSSFHASLKLARKLYAAKTERRIAITAELRELTEEIPFLERTIKALEAQIEQRGSGGAVSSLESRFATLQSGAPPGVGERIKQQMERLSAAPPGEIPPEVRAKLPPEDFSGFGSHFGSEAAPQEDFLPEIQGKEVIPEKKP